MKLFRKIRQIHSDIKFRNHWKNIEFKEKIYLQASTLRELEIDNAKPLIKERFDKLRPIDGRLHFYGPHLIDYGRFKGICGELTVLINPISDRSMLGKLQYVLFGR